MPKYALHRSTTASIYVPCCTCVCIIDHVGMTAILAQKCSNPRTQVWPDLDGVVQSSTKIEAD